MSVSVAPLITSEIADTTTFGLISAMLGQLDRVRPANQEKALYYEGEKLIQPSLTIPRQWVNARQAAGWPGTVVDVLEERLDLLGWAGSDHAKAAFEASDLDTEASLGHLDALIYGISFVAVDTDQELPRVTIESPQAMTGLWDHSSRGLSHALLVSRADAATGQASEVVLFDDLSARSFARHGGGWRLLDVRAHGLRRCPVVQLVNRPRASRLGGRSEITHTVRRLTDSAVRTLAALEVNRDFYSFPQRWTTGADDEDFTEDDGTDTPGWQTAMAAHLVIGTNSSGEQPRMGAFTVNPPTVYLEQIQGLAQLLASEAGLPAHYMGFHTENPAAEGAIKASESRLVKRAEKRQATFGKAWRDVARIVAAAMGRDDAGISCIWRDPATPTSAATADEVMKLVSAGVLTPDSGLTYDRIGLTPAEQARLKADKAAAGPSAAQAIAEALTRQAAPEVPGGADAARG